MAKEKQWATHLFNFFTRGHFLTYGNDGVARPTF